MERIFLGQLRENAPPIRLVLHSGAVFYGLPVGTEDDLFVLRLVDPTGTPTGRRAWIRAAQVAALEIDEDTIPSLPQAQSPDTVDQLPAAVHAWLENHSSALPAEFHWLHTPPLPPVVASAWETFVAVQQAIAALRAEPWMDRLLSEQLHRLEIREESGHRVRLENQVLAVSFTAGEPPLPMRELAGLLASIL